MRCRLLPVLLIACCLLPIASRAAASPPDCAAASPAADPAVALADHLRQEAACGRNPRFLYRLGQLLNAAARYPEAADRLEAALLHDPDDWRTRLEYAIALAGSGDAAAAQHLLVQLRPDPAVDTATRQQIDLLLGRHWLRANLPQGSVSLMIGHDDNLLGAARQGAFDLTLPYGNLTVVPGADQQPRAGFFTRADIQLNGTVPVGDDRSLRYGLFGSLRWTPDQPADRTHWGVLLEKNNIGIPGGYLQAAWQQINLQSATLYRQAHLGAGLAAVGGAWGIVCRHRLGLELQLRNYPQADPLDGRYGGLHLQTVCPAQGVEIALRHGQDRPRAAERPGGAQRQTALGIAHETGFYRGSLRVAAEWSWQRDATGYSPLLENNRRRALQRGIYRIEYRWAASGWQPFARLEWLEQNANLPLFSLRNRVFSVGLTAAW